MSRCALLNSFCTSILAVCARNAAFVLKGREQRQVQVTASRLLCRRPVPGRDCGIELDQRLQQVVLSIN